tara:strand:- start:970 stop:1479 length:510 start_codon:yes stop_codon:yes gene_type:complete
MKKPKTMKKIILFIAVVTSSLCTMAQDKMNTFPSVNLKTVEGKTINSSTFENDGNPIVISFWATWCKPCAKELDAISEIYDDWQDETGVKVIAISIDDARNSAKVAPYANGKDWPFDIYLDANSDLKRALNVNAIPHTFLLNAKKEIVWQHTSYFDGDEEELFEEIKKL